MSMELVKSLLATPDATTEAEFLEQWPSIDSGLRSQIKILLFNTLGSSDRQASLSASRLIPKLAAVYVQEDISIGAKGDLAQDDVNLLITALKYGLDLSEQDEVRLAAANILCNTLECAGMSSFHLKRIMGVLLLSIEAKDLHVAPKVCEAIFYTVQQYEDAGPSTYLSVRLPNFIAFLMECADGSDSELMTCAYEALNELVRRSNLDHASSMLRLLLRKIMDKLGENLLEVDSEQQANRCRVVGVLIHKISSDSETKVTIRERADSIVAILHKVFACCSSTVYVEAMNAMGEIADAVGPEFDKFMREFYQYLKMGIRNLEEYQICAISVCIFGCICRALGDLVLPYCDEIMYQLILNLRSSKLHPTVQPLIFACIRDMAFVMNEQFGKHAEDVLELMHTAAKNCRVLVRDESGNHVMHSLFEAYSGILLGWKSSELVDVWQTHAPHFMEFLSMVAKDPFRDKLVTGSAVDALGVLADSLAHVQWIRCLFQSCPFYVGLLNACLRSNDEDLTQKALWTQWMIGRVLGYCS